MGPNWRSCKAHYLKRSCKFGIAIPKDVKDAYELDRGNGNTLWADAIAKEMEAVCIAFQILGDDQKPPPGYQEIKCHMVFDIKIEDF